jgi:uncharacterized membrane protein YoaK (UPF0700 family)
MQVFFKESNQMLKLVLLLSMTAGATDTVGFLALDLFTAHITGNLVILAAHEVMGAKTGLAPILSVPVFMVMVGFARAFAIVLERRQMPTLTPLLVLHFALVAGFFLLSWPLRNAFNSDGLLAVSAGLCGASAMAVQNALVQTSLPHAPSTAVLTTNITRFSSDVVAIVFGDSNVSRAARKRALDILPAIVGFLAGCTAAALLYSYIGMRALALPAVLALAAVFVGMWQFEIGREAGSR